MMKSYFYLTLVICFATFSFNSCVDNAIAYETEVQEAVCAELQDLLSDAGYLTLTPLMGITASYKLTSIHSSIIPNQSYFYAQFQVSNLNYFHAKRGPPQA